ncbi:hypothetical protein QEZ54_22020 [Catellatospora sp. KI3]|uniref:hypothetical protein n=1 Tax=Catellatospora sp. KI3 TaxID=3041620 RepID=UPI0024830AB1|nr:hypothetical protein [Catellatospora sp. KI3]MDI1463663.1 hypothetical protein [Catellatospora sp. KI3]
MHPPPHVLAAFGATAPPTPLPGGQGHTWLSGTIVLKPAGLPAEHEWTATTLAAIPDTPQLRLARPIPAADGHWTHHGWQANRHLPGHPDPRRVHETLTAGQHLHQALAHLPRPEFLDHRDDPWTHGDHIAFDEQPLPATGPMTELLHQLAAARHPIDLPSQPVHGDLLGNVLFAPGLPPAVIDWPVYHRPADWALAVAVTDAITWHDAPADLHTGHQHRPHWRQLAIRALMYRIATTTGRHRAGLPTTDDTARYQPVVDQVLGS